MSNLLDSLGYDFQNFTVPDFIKHLEELRGKTFHFIPKNLIGLGAFGAWLTSDQDELFFYQQTAVPAHRIHIILHEICHMLCGHETDYIPPENVKQIINGREFNLINAIRRHPSHTDVEAEVEMMASLIRHTLLNQKRLTQLAAINPPDEATKLYLRDIGLL